MNIQMYSFIYFYLKKFDFFLCAVKCLGIFVETCICVSVHRDQKMVSGVVLCHFPSILFDAGSHLKSAAHVFVARLEVSKPVILL